MQLVALARYEPAPQIEHSAALKLVLYSAVPSHALHARSDVAVGAPDTKLPGAHVRQAVQMRGAVAEPADEMNSVPEQVGCGSHPFWPGLSW